MKPEHVHVRGGVRVTCREAGCGELRHQSCTQSPTPRTDEAVARDMRDPANWANLARELERDAADWRARFDGKVAYMRETEATRHQVNRWIPVSERLPEEGARVLAFWQVADGMTPNHENYAKALFTHGSWMDDGGDNLYADASHWMPLPEAPK